VKSDKQVDRDTININKIKPIENMLDNYNLTSLFSFI
jgi:hypothetical protein